MRIDVLVKATLMIFATFALSAIEKLYVLNTTGNTVSVVDTATDTVLSTLSGFNQPLQGVYDANLQKCYITNLSSNPGQVTVINTQTDQVISTITVVANPESLALAPELNKLFVAAGFTSSLNIIDTISETVIATVTIGTDAGDVLYVPSVQKVYVANNTPGNGSVSVIDAINNVNITTIANPASSGFPRFLSLSCDQTKVYVSNNFGAQNEIHTISTTTDTLLATISVGTRPRELFIDCNTGIGYVANQTGNSVTLVNTATDLVISTLTVPAFSTPVYSQVLPSADQLYVSNSGNSRVYIFSLSTNANTANILLTPGPVTADKFVFNTAGTKAYVHNFSGTGNRIYVIDTASQTLANSIVVGLQPSFSVLIPEPIIPPTPTPSLPSSPSCLRGSQFLNTFLTQRTRTNKLMWNPPTSGSQPVEYRIYRNASLTQLAAIVSASGPLLFVDGIRRNTSTCYYIVSVDAQGQVSSPAAICIGPR